MFKRFTISKELEDAYADHERYKQNIEIIRKRKEKTFYAHLPGARTYLEEKLHSCIFQCRHPEKIISAMSDIEVCQVCNHEKALTEMVDKYQSKLPTDFEMLEIIVQKTAPINAQLAKVIYYNAYGEKTMGTNTFSFNSLSEDSAETIEDYWKRFDKENN